MTASERQAHILGMIDKLTADIGAYLAQFTDEDQAAALPLAIILRCRLCRYEWRSTNDHAQLWKERNQP